MNIDDQIREINNKLSITGETLPQLILAITDGSLAPEKEAELGDLLIAMGSLLSQRARLRLRSCEE